MSFFADARPVRAGDVRAASIFGALSDEDFRALEGVVSSREWGRGERLVHRGDPVLAVFWIVKGWVKLTRETHEGDEAILDVLGPGSTLGETDLMNGLTHSGSATVVEDAEIWAIPAARFKALVEERPSLSTALVKSLGRARRLVDMELENRTLKNAPQRIGCFLMRLVPTGYKGRDLSILLPYDKMVVAGKLGMQPETFSRALATLRKDVGLVVRGRSVDVPDFAALRAYVCGACSAAWPCEDRR